MGNSGENEGYGIFQKIITLEVDGLTATLAYEVSIKFATELTNLVPEVGASCISSRPI